MTVQSIGGLPLGAFAGCAANGANAIMAAHAATPKILRKTETPDQKR